MAFSSTGVFIGIAITAALIVPAVLAMPKTPAAGSQPCAPGHRRDGMRSSRAEPGRDSRASEGQDGRMTAYIAPPRRIPLLLRFGLWISRRVDGEDVLPARLLTWNPRSAVGIGVLESLVARGEGRVD